MHILSDDKIDVPGKLLTINTSVAELVNARTACRIGLNKPVQSYMSEAQAALALSGLINQENALSMDDCFGSQTIAF